MKTPVEKNSFGNTYGEHREFLNLVLISTKSFIIIVQKTKLNILVLSGM